MSKQNLKDSMMATTQSSLEADRSEHSPAPLLAILLESLSLHQAVFAAAELAIADHLANGPRSAGDLAKELNVLKDPLYRVLRLLASENIFFETLPGVFENTPISNCLRSDAPVSLRAMARLRGSDFLYRSFGEILHTLRTGETGREKALGMDGWEYLRSNPEMACIFDDAMTSLARIAAPGIAAAYDFSRWESLMDVGGGNGVLLAAILGAHPKLRGVLGDQQHVLERARERAFLGGEVANRSSMQACDLFSNIPSGCQAYLVKSVIHDWDDEDSARILRNCRKAVPNNGALLLVEFDLPEDGSSSRGKFTDITMMVVTGGKERTISEYKSLLSTAGFQLTKVTPTPTGFNVIEAAPV
jgi:hypothetical protein